jgi:hypothetical protein
LKETPALNGVHLEKNEIKDIKDSANKVFICIDKNEKFKVLKGGDEYIHEHEEIFQRAFRHIFKGAKRYYLDLAKIERSKVLKGAYKTFDKDAYKEEMRRENAEFDEYGNKFSPDADYSEDQNHHDDWND